MVTLTRLLGACIAWLTASPRRIIAAIAVPVFAVIVLAGPDHNGRGVSSATQDAQTPTAPTASSGTGRPGTGTDGSTEGNGGGSTDGTGGGDGTSGGSATSSPTGAPEGGLPTAPVSVGPSDTPRPDPVLPEAAASVAVGYTQTVNSHDARSGKDHEFLDSYRRATPFVTSELYDKITADRRSGDVQWTQWTAQQAIVTVHIDRVAVPDGAPLPTSTKAYVRVRFTQIVTPHTGGAKPSSNPGEVTLVAEHQQNGRWLVSELLVA